MIPFLGSGINLYNRYPILDIRREDYPDYPLTLEEYVNHPTDHPLSEIELASLLTREIVKIIPNRRSEDEGNSGGLIGKLVGFPCVSCHLNIEERPSVCPVRKKK